MGFICRCIIYCYYTRRIQLIIFDTTRWLNSFNAAAASQGKQRQVAKRWAGENFSVEETPFIFPVKDEKGNYEIGSAVWGYVKDLPVHVLDFLDNLHRYLIFDSCLQYISPSCSSEFLNIKNINWFLLVIIWSNITNTLTMKFTLRSVVIMGRNLSKPATYQICNTVSPNSKDKTVVFSLFEAKDYRSNLRTGLSMFTTQIDNLQLMKGK